MRAYDYDAVVYDGAVYCIECLPKGVDIESDDVSPIFADQEWDYAPVCDECKCIHDYVTILLFCECSDPGCPKCAGSCSTRADVIAYRVDMDDESGIPMCYGCADDARDSGLFRLEDTAFAGQIMLHTKL